ncbi:MAG: 16S rRNA (guanine(527)-N(7))-methyltransferase RsmG [Dehalococcoidia bacterium]|nr:16S rRNA (guanine(527)-N(7))-methyltransferase RsmG [Dehalococcoidia bacterium]
MVSGAAKLGFSLSEHQIAQFQRYYAELEQWNQRVNLTAVTVPEEVEARHFLDSLTVALAFPDGLGGVGRLLDVGSGAGFPGLPLNLAFPGLRLALMDSVGKKTVFLRHLCDVLGLTDVEVYTGRAEALAHGEMREAFDGVVSRAVAPMNVLAELTLPFCRVGGLAVAMKSEDSAEEVAQAERAIGVLGGRLEKVVAVRLEELGERRSLVVVRKVSPTPERYPRRPGIPAKRSL